MSNLYVKVYSDTRKEPATATGRNFIEVLLHYNKKNYNDKIRVTMSRFEDGKVVISAWALTKDGSGGEVKLLEMKGGKQ